MNKIERKYFFNPSLKKYLFREELEKHIKNFYLLSLHALAGLGLVMIAVIIFL